MSLMASPVGDVFDGPEVLTISPADLLAADLQSDDEKDSQELSLCYAMLEFPDSYYPLRVTNVVIGRDVKVQRLMERSSDIWVDGKMVRKHPIKRKRSLVEPDEGDEEEEEEYDSDADSYYDSAPSLTLEEGTTLVGGIGGMQVHPIDTGENEQFIAVHPPANERTGQIPGLTSISKQHLRISFKDGIGWTMEVLGRNGAYLNDEHWPQSEEALLQDNDRIMIVGLQIVFRLRGPADWTNSDEDEASDAGSDLVIAQETTEGGKTQVKKKMATIGTSDDDLSDIVDDEEEDLAPVTPVPRPKIKLRLDVAPKSKPKVEKEKKLAAPKPPPEAPVGDIEPSEEKESSAEKKPVSEKVVQDTQVLLQSLLAPGEVRPERRGPGRPPKNGVMSKREMRARQKAVKAGLPYEDALSAKAKGQSRTRKDSEGDADEADVDGEGRKRKKARRSETAGEEGSGIGQADAGSDDEAKKDLTPKPPREPTPKEEDFPEEKLQKPEGTYQALLHLVLSEAKAPMALQQIYEDVKKRWPYYRFRVQSNGWESSVRHNLQSNTCFMKAGKEGKGHLWTIDPNVAFEPKPKRASPPPHPQPYYHHGPIPQGMQQMRPGLMHNQMPGAPYAHPYPGPYGQPPTMVNGHRPPIPAKPQASQYSSPYSPNTAAPGQQPRPPYQAGQGMGTPQTAGGPLKTYTTHVPVSYRPPPPGMAHAGNAPPGSRPPGPPLANQPRLPAPAQGHLPNQALSRPMSLASTPQGTLAQRTTTSGPMRPATQPSNSANDCSALEKVFRGQVPEIFTRFKENLRNMPGAVTTPSQELQINQQIDQTIEWIMSNARRPDFATCEVVDQPDSVKATVRILRQMLYDDHRTFKNRLAGTPAPHAPNRPPVSTPATTPRQGVASPALPITGQGTAISRPVAANPISAPPGIINNHVINKPIQGSLVQRPQIPQVPLMRAAQSNTATSQTTVQNIGPYRPSGPQGPTAVPASGTAAPAVPQQPQRPLTSQGAPQTPVAQTIATPISKTVSQTTATQIPTSIAGPATGGVTMQPQQANGTQQANTSQVTPNVATPKPVIINQPPVKVDAASPIPATKA